MKAHRGKHDWPLRTARQNCQCVPSASLGKSEFDIAIHGRHALTHQHFTEGTSDS